MSKLVPGMKVKYLPQPDWGVGHLVALHDEGVRAEVIFPGREGGAILVSARGGALVGHQLKPGDRVKTSKGKAAVVTEEVEGGRGLRRYVYKFDDGTEDEAPESELRVDPPKPDMFSLLREGRVGDAHAFELRKQALFLDDERRNDALGALFASRVMVKPHQVGVVQRVLSARRPRFVLADEVGLGKTIEAGMVFSALRLAGMANRVLVVAPSHLTVQWLAELFHKFSQLFTLMDGDRYAQSLKEQPDVSPWARFPRVVTSLELLSRTDEHREQASAPGAFWDLVIIDEAHHLKGEKAFAAARALAENTWGLLLLTATPMQLDPAEYRGLLTLIDAETAPSQKEFEQRLSRQEELSQAVRALLDAKKPDAAVKQLAARFPDDGKLKTLKDRDALLQHLAETYSLSDRLIRNRRVVVGGFAERRLHRHVVTLDAADLEARARVAETTQLRGAALSNLLRRLESSPAAFLEAAKGEVQLPDRDPKLAEFVKVLRGIWEKEPDAKVLVFTEARATLDWLQQQLLKERVEALGYHGDLALVERDRQVARFRDPEGPKVLICTEVGGEGRNFQFAHHLVNYDLPWSPAAMEQRIGRLDRIGQTKPVDIHVFDLPGTLSADVLSVLADSVGVFSETVGGLDAVLEEVEPNLLELAQKTKEERAQYAKELHDKVAAAREQVKRAYDPLLDLRSFDQNAVRALVERAQRRMHMEEEEEGGLEDGLWAIARDLDERLEEAVAELARRVGIGVDVEEQVEAFQTALHFGHALKVDALPGMDLTQERTLLGTFWRDTAVEQEEIEYFATGHPIVESLFGFLRDGPYGRNAFRYFERRGPGKVRGMEALFHIVPPEPEDTSVGARVPSRQLSRFIEKWLLHVAVVAGPDGKPKVDASVLPTLEKKGRTVKGDEVRMAFPGFAEFVDPAMLAATMAADAELKAVRKKASAAIEAECEQSLERLQLSLGHQGLDEKRIDAQLAHERAHYDALLKALDGLKVVPDSVAGFAINR